MQLKCIEIINWGLYAHAQWEIHQGLTVLIGESGSGKSMLYEALCFALGANCDVRCIRHGALESTVRLHFQDQTAVVFERTLTQHGKTHQRKNQKNIPLKQLKWELGANITLVKQHAQLQLLNSDYLLETLDHFTKDALENYQACYRAHQDIEAAIARQEQCLLTSAELKRLETELAELEQVAPEGSWEEAESKLHELEQAQKCALLIQECLEILRASSQLKSQLIRHYDLFSSNIQHLSDQFIDAQEALSREMQLEQSRLGDCEHEWGQQDARMSKWHLLAQRYRIPPAQLHTLLLEKQERQNQHHQAHLMLPKLYQERDVLNQHRHEAALELRMQRQSHAERLQASMQASLEKLGFLERDLIWKWDRQAPSQNGEDRLTLCLAHRQDGIAHPLKNVASGGELSRILMGLHGQIPHRDVLFFDEVDAGLSGKIAMQLGQYLAQLSRQQPIVVISHAPQIAAFADHLWSLEKHTHPTLRTELLAIAKEERALCLKNLLAGQHPSETALRHAEHLIQEAAQLNHD